MPSYHYIGFCFIDGRSTIQKGKYLPRRFHPPIQHASKLYFRYLHDTISLLVYVDYEGPPKKVFTLSIVLFFFIELNHNGWLKLTVPRISGLLLATLNCPPLIWPSRTNYY